MIFRILGAQWLATCFVGAVSFGMSIFVARAFGPDLFGIYAITLSLGALISILIDGGFSKLLQRERVRTTASLATLLPALPGFAYGHALSVILVLSLLSELFFPQFSLTALATVWFFGAAVLNQFGLAILRGDGRLLRDASWQVGNRTFTAICVALILLLGANQPWQVLMAQFIGAAMFGLLITRYLHIRPLFHLSPTLYRAVLPFVWLDFASVLYFRVDMMIFEFLNISKSEVGKYGVAYRLIEAVVMLAAPVGLILFRRFRQTSAAPTLMVKKMVPALLAAALLGMVLVLMLYLFADYTIALTYGPAYQGAGTLLITLGVSLIFLLPNGILNQAAMALGLERWFAVSASLAACTNIAGNFLLIPTYGVLGAAWMTVVTEAILTLSIALGILLHCKHSLSVEKELLV